MCGERWRKDCRPCLLPRDCCLSYLHVLTLAPHHRPPLSDRSPSNVDIGYCGHGTPPGRQTHPLCPWRRWCVGGERYRRCRFGCVQLPKQFPSPAPVQLLSRPHQSPIKVLAPAPSTRQPSSIKSHAFLHQSDQSDLLLQGTPTSSPISPPFRHSGFHSPAPNPYPAPP